MATRAPLRAYRTWYLDSRHWLDYRHRPGDIIIATYPKSGTTWMQRIVSLLIFQSAEPVAMAAVSPWLDRRFMEGGAAMMARLDQQDHRRFLKTHVPLDGLPLIDEVRYIHVARDGRDVALSYHNHLTGMTEATLAEFDANGLADPTIARPYPRAPADPRAFFRRWLTQEAVAGEGDGMPSVSYFNYARSFWAERRRANILFVHYDDLKRDLDGEMRRIAGFLDIAVPGELWPDLVEAAGFAAMRAAGEALMPHLSGHMEQGARRFFARGETGRWQGVLGDDELALYDAKLAAKVPPGCADWLARGRLGAGEPRDLPD